MSGTPAIGASLTGSPPKQTSPMLKSNSVGEAQTAHHATEIAYLRMVLMRTDRKRVPATVARAM